MREKFSNNNPLQIQKQNNWILNDFTTLFRNMMYVECKKK